MNTLTQNVRVLGKVSPEARRGLRRLLLRAPTIFQVYARLFDDIGVSLDEIEHRDPLDVLRRIPVMDTDTFHQLAQESVLACDQIVDTTATAWWPPLCQFWSISTPG